MVWGQIGKRAVTTLVRQRNIVQGAKELTQTKACGELATQCRQYKNVCGMDSILMTKPAKMPVNTETLRLAPGARSVSQYTLKNGKKVRIYTASVDDKEMLEKTLADMEKYLDIHKIPTEGNENRFIIEKCFKILKEMTEKGVKDPKTHMYIAEQDSKVCGILIGGLPKVTPKGKPVFSAREGALPTETELNWIATWPEGNGVGKALFSEYLTTMKKDGFSDMFIQSEIPKFTYASKFYERMGFKIMHPKNPEQPVSKVEYNKDILDCLSLDDPNEMHDYLIIPMMGKRQKVQKMAEDIAEQCERETFVKAVDSKNFVHELDTVG